MLDVLKKLVDDVTTLFIISAAVTLAGVLVIETWRKSPLTPAAGLILGVVFGYGASVADTGPWIVFWTIIGTIAGPNLLVWLQGEGVAAQIGQLLLDKFSKRSKHGSSNKVDRRPDSGDNPEEVEREE